MPSGSDIIGRIREAVGSLTNKVASPLALTGRTQFVQWLDNRFHQAPPTPSTQSILKLFQTSPWVHMLISKISLSSATVRFHLEDREGQRIYASPVLDFINSGSEYLTGLQSLFVHYAYMQLCGESFWLIGRDAQGRPNSWMPIPPLWVHDVGYLPGSSYRINSPYAAPVNVPAEDVIWFKKPDPFDPIRRGVAITRAAMGEISVDKAASEHVFSFLRNRARPDIIISGTQAAPLNVDDVRRLEEAYLPKFQGAQNAGRPLFSANELSIKEIGASLREHQFTELRKQEADILAQLYGVPPETFGRLENSNRATVEGADYLYNSHVIVPSVILTLSPLDARLGYEFKREMNGLRLNFDSPVQENKEVQLKVLVAAPNVFRVNEARAIAGLAPLPGSEGLEMVQSVEEVDPQADPDATGEKKKPKRKPKKSVLRKKAFASGDVDRIVEAALASGDEDRTVFAEIFESIFTDWGREIGKEIKIDFLYEADAALWISNAVDDMMSLIDETTADEIRASIEAALERSEESEIRGALLGTFASATRVRAPRIALTEINSIAGFATVSALRQAGLQTKTWHTQRDDRVRDQHAAMEGQTVPVNERFIAPNGDTALHPGGFSSANQNANCRCFSTHTGSSRTFDQHTKALNSAIDVLVPEIAERFNRQRDRALARLTELQGE